MQEIILPSFAYEITPGLWALPELEFEGCIILGPCVLLLTKGSHLIFDNNHTFGNFAATWVPWDGMAPLGGIIIQRLSFIGCHLRGISFLGNHDAVTLAAKATTVVS